MNLLLSLGSIIFFCSSVFFLITSKKKFNSAFFVSFITLISYLVMLEGSFITSNLLWTRWLGYALSCSILIYIISKKIGLSLNQQISNVLLNIIVMVTGILASINTGEYKWYFFVLSSLAYIIVLYEIFKSKPKKLSLVRNYIIFGWTAFPIVFLFSNEGLNLLPIEVSILIYLLLDFFTKIIFYLRTDFYQKK